MKKTLLLILVVMLLFSFTDTAMAGKTDTTGKPKYIFIIIGDGFGVSHAALGSIYSRIANGDMNNGANWESFSQYYIINACNESASGGTALATGYLPTKADRISVTSENEDLYTIMDRASDNDFATGVITNSYIYDATPATFLSHTNYRGTVGEIMKEIPTSNVDFIMGGGVWKMVPYNRLEEINYQDSSGNTVKNQSRMPTIDTLEDMGYTSFLAMDGGKLLLEQLDNDSLIPTKSIGIFSYERMPYEIEQHSIYKAEEHQYTPTLVNMTNAGINALSQDNEGFVMMIEEAFIDKTVHNGNEYATLCQIELLNRTVGAVLDFYNEHPDETLIILTADHETGKYSYDEDKLKEFYTKDDFEYNGTAAETYNFLINRWDVYISSSQLSKKLYIANSETWETDEENRRDIYALIALEVGHRIDIAPTSRGHSFQDVPLYVTGPYAEEFAEVEHICDIPATICEIMGWDALPEIVTNNAS